MRLNVQCNAVSAAALLLTLNNSFNLLLKRQLHYCALRCHRSSKMQDAAVAQLVTKVTTAFQQRFYG